MTTAGDRRKQRGAWYTPPELVDRLVDGLLDGFEAPAVTRVLDPACGDGRLLSAVGERLHRRGHAVELTGCDIDADALASIPESSVMRIHADALERDWGGATFDLVIANPPFLSQMATGTTRGGSSRHGGGPYAGAAVEFLALAVNLADASAGRIALVLPQSVLGARDAAQVRERVDRLADITWSYWEPDQRHFDAAVNVCLVGLRRPATGSASSWTRIITDRLGVPALDTDQLRSNSSLGDRAALNANFRDEYYALVPAVSDAVDGPPLVTSGLIDPGRCHWGDRTVRFAKQDFQRPRVDLSKLTGRFVTWAERKLVPKVLVASQTRIVEAVADPGGVWLPGVPVTTVTPVPSTSVWEVAAVLTSPVASAVTFQRSAGTGLSTTSVRIGPATLAQIPWPVGELDRAVERLREGDVLGCGGAVCRAFGLDSGDTSRMMMWWSERLPTDR